MKTKTKWDSFLLSLIVFIALIVPENTFSQNVGDAAPDFTLSVLGGTSFKLSDYKGKVVFIFLFGYACPHCLANGNNTETGIYDVYKSNSDFEAVGVDTWDGNESGVESFKSSTGLTYPLCLMGSSVLDLYNTTYDRIIVVDKEGIIRYKAVANSTSDVVSEASDVISNYLGGTMTPSAVKNINNDNGLLKIYPIPANDRVQIRSNMKPGGTASIRIISISGKIVMEKKINTITSGENISISVNNLVDGMYYLQFTTPEDTMTGKLIVDRN